MSRIGKKPIPIASQVTVVLEGDRVVVKGPQGGNSLELHPEVEVVQKDGVLTVSVKHPETNEGKALWGLYRALLANVLQGVTKPFEEKLELVGVGYKTAISGKKLVLEVGASHPIAIEIPEGITCAVEKNVITISGVDKQLVGEIAARIRAVRKPEPYKGKGIRYVGEVIRRKAGKAAKAAGVK